MKNSITFSVVFTAITLLISCEKDEISDVEAINGAGEIIEKTLVLDPFTHIEFEGVANLYVNLGNGQQVRVKAQENILSVLTWEVTEGTLYVGIREGIRIRNHEEIRFEIEVEALHTLLHDGVGDVTLEGIKANNLDIDYRGIGTIDSYNLPLDHCTLFTSGTGNCSIRVSETLDVDISGIGSVYYKGHPQINFFDTGLGELVNDN